MLHFNVDHQSLSRTDTFRPVSASKDYLRCTFSFSEDWSGLQRTALFKSQTGAVYSVTLDQDDACMVPDEILSGNPSKYITVSCYGTSPSGAENPVFLPSNSTRVFLETAGYWQD